MKKTLFTIDYHEFSNFLNDEDINAIIQTIYKGKLKEYDYFEGKAYTTMGENEADILDFHPDIQKKIEEKCFVKNQRISIQTKSCDESHFRIELSKTKPYYQGHNGSKTIDYGCQC